jgi:hypothetical protein
MSNETFFAIVTIAFGLILLGIIAGNTPDKKK